MAAAAVVDPLVTVKLSICLMDYQTSPLELVVVVVVVPEMDKEVFYLPPSPITLMEKMPPLTLMLLEEKVGNL